MKVGIVGGVGYASTIDYYKGIEEKFREIKQDNSYAEILIDSINMTEMIGFLEKKDFDSLENMLLKSINNLKNGSADFCGIASNTPHIIFDRIKEKSPIPIFSIVETTCDECLKNNYKNVLVLGTKFTMQNGLYVKPLLEKGIDCVKTNSFFIDTVHSIIFPKLEDGIVDLNDKLKLTTLCNDMILEKQIDAVILGCTELPMMIKQGDLIAPVLNTTQIHIGKLVEMLTK